MAENFAFVMNIASLQDGSYELAPGHVLRRATHEEIDIIRERLALLAGAPMGAFSTLPWQEEWPPPAGKPIKILPEAKWRFFVIAFCGTNEVIVRIQEALDLARAELEVGFTELTDLGGGAAYHPERLFLLQRAAQSSQLKKSFFLTVTNSAIEDIRYTYALFDRDDADAKPAKLAADQLGQLKALPPYSSLRVLGYFAILESLLTHAPKPSDPYDSITRQIKKKLALLENRWSTPLDYSPFGGTAVDKIWSKMYEYRSQIAHGGTPNFKGDLQVLLSDEHASHLIKEAAKAVIRQALIEPRLLLDLREC